MFIIDLYRSICLVVQTVLAPGSPDSSKQSIKIALPPEEAALFKEVSSKIN